MRSLVHVSSLCSNTPAMTARGMRPGHGACACASVATPGRRAGPSADPTWSASTRTSGAKFSRFTRTRVDLARVKSHELSINELQREHQSLRPLPGASKPSTQQVGVRPRSRNSIAGLFVTSMSAERGLCPFPAPARASGGSERAVLFGGRGRPNGRRLELLGQSACYNVNNDCIRNDETSLRALPEPRQVESRWRSISPRASRNFRACTRSSR